MLSIPPIEATEVQYGGVKVQGEQYSAAAGGVTMCFFGWYEKYMWHQSGSHIYLHES